jgi:hypothetical protein
MSMAGGSLTGNPNLFRARKHAAVASSSAARACFDFHGRMRRLQPIDQRVKRGTRAAAPVTSRFMSLPESEQRVSSARRLRIAETSVRAMSSTA